MVLPASRLAVSLGGWHAYADERELKMCGAGPDFMYVTLRGDTSYPTEAIFEYRKSTLEWASLVICTGTSMGLATHTMKPYLLDLSSVPWLSKAHESRTCTSLAQQFPTSKGGGIHDYPGEQPDFNGESFTLPPAKRATVP